MAKIHYADLWGLREGKYRTLAGTDIATTEWAELEPRSPFYLFVPRGEELVSEYEQGWKVTDIFPVNSVGVVTARDELAIRWSSQDMWETVQRFSSLTSEEARERYHLGNDARDWKVALAQRDVKDSKLRQELVVPITYRALDIRYTYYTGHSRGFICMPRQEVMRHMMSGENLGFVFQRGCSSSNTMNPPQVSVHPIDQGTSYPANRALSYLAPLYLYPTEREMRFEEGHRSPNLNPKFIEALSSKLGLAFVFVEDGKGDLTKAFGPEDIFNYAYAVLHSPTYRSRYAEFLKMDFPRLPLTSDKELFRALVDKGAELVELHLMESPKLNSLMTSYPVSGSSIVEKVSYDENYRRVHINKLQYFEGVPSDVWNFQIGGYQVCQKWLKDRKGRTLSYDDLTHYQKIVVALKETIHLMAEIDALIPSWPIG